MPQITPEMIEAGRRIAEDNAMRFWWSSRTDQDWAWFLSIVYRTMREREPKENDEQGLGDVVKR